MIEKSYHTQTDEQDWDSMMRKIVKVYVEDTISTKQAVGMSGRILKNLKDREMRKRNLTLVIGGASKRSAPLWRLPATGR